MVVRGVTWPNEVVYTLAGSGVPPGPLFALFHFHCQAIRAQEAEQAPMQVHRPSQTCLPISKRDYQPCQSLNKIRYLASAKRDSQLAVALQFSRQILQREWHNPWPCFLSSRSTHDSGTLPAWFDSSNFLARLREGSTDDANHTLSVYENTTTVSLTNFIPAQSPVAAALAGGDAAT